jgi:hypothetical protein
VASGAGTPTNQNKLVRSDTLIDTPSYRRILHQSRRQLLKVKSLFTDAAIIIEQNKWRFDGKNKACITIIKMLKCK